MRNIKYTDSVTFRCLEHLRETSLDISLIHAGKEQCEPSHICTKTRSEYILHFVLSGKGFYSLKNCSNYPVTAGQMFLILPGEAVTYGADAAEPWQYAWIGFNGIRANTIIRRCGFLGSTRILPSPVQPDTVMDCIDHILDCKSLTFAHYLRREAWMLMLFSRLMDHYEQSHRHTPDTGSYGTRAYVELAVEHIKYYHGYGIHVSDIAGHLGISRAYLNHAFQKELGISVQKFLIEFRLHKAANLLADTNDTIKEISAAVGYEDQLNFSKAFKKKFGISPKNYRAHKASAVHYAEKQLEDHPADFTD